MYKITKLNGCASAFKLKDKRVFLFEPGVAVEVSDDDYKAIMAEYSSFILPRVYSKENPTGCFLIERIEEAKSEEKEVVEEVAEEVKPVAKKKTRKK